jgi:hypothetical protein
LLYVNVASLDEAVKVVEEMGRLVVRPKTAVPKVAWVANRRNSSVKEEEYERDFDGLYYANDKKYTIDKKYTSLEKGSYHSELGGTGPAP